MQRKAIDFFGKALNYTDQGEGDCIVFLHGYLESLEIWDGFIQGFAHRYRVVCIDLPGHGESTVLGERQTMEQMTGRVIMLLDHLGIEKCFMVGHSMGGYVALVFHFLYPGRLFGFSLFHSHPFSDPEQVVDKRLREIEMVKEGKKGALASINIPNAFAADNHEKFKAEIENAKQIALHTPDNGIIACLHAMMKRNDMSGPLGGSNIPFLYVLGKKDFYIDYALMAERVKMPAGSKLILLENSGHMGFIEERDGLTKFFSNYINSILSIV